MDRWMEGGGVKQGGTNKGSGETYVGFPLSCSLPERLKRARCRWNGAIVYVGDIDVSAGVTIDSEARCGGDGNHTAARGGGCPLLDIMLLRFQRSVGLNISFLSFLFLFFLFPYFSVFWFKDDGCSTSSTLRKNINSPSLPLFLSHSPPLSLLHAKQVLPLLPQTNIHRSSCSLVLSSEPPPDQEHQPLPQKKSWISEKSSTRKSPRLPHRHRVCLSSLHSIPASVLTIHPDRTTTKEGPTGARRARHRSEGLGRRAAEAGHAHRGPKHVPSAEPLSLSFPFSQDASRPPNRQTGIVIVATRGGDGGGEREGRKRREGRIHSTIHRPRPIKSTLSRIMRSSTGRRLLYFRQKRVYITYRGPGGLGSIQLACQDSCDGRSGRPGLDLGG